MGLFDRLYYGKAGKRDYSEMDMPKNPYISKIGRAHV